MTYRKVSIRINILTNFLILIGIISVSLLGLEYYFSQKLSLSATQQTFTKLAQNVTQLFQSKDENVKNMLYLSEHYSDLLFSANAKEHQVTFERFAYHMKRRPAIYAMYMGYENGDMYEVINMHVSKDLYVHYKAPEQTRWIVLKIFGAETNRIKFLEYYDKEFRLLNKSSEPSDYKVTTRPWYIEAIQSDKAIRTDPYLYSNLQQMGITYSKQVHDSKAVLAIDFTLDELTSILKQHKMDPSNTISMFTKDIGIVVSTDENQDNLKDKLFNKVLLEDNVGKLVQYEEKEIAKFAMLSPISQEADEDTYIGITLNTDVMLDPYMQQVYYSLVIAFVFLILSIPLILYTTARIVRPVKSLMEQNEKVELRAFDEVKHIGTHITELAELSDSLVSMAKSIQSYQRAQAELMDSFIELIADAIDAKSHYTGGHCQRVPEIAMMLAKSAEESKEGAFKDFRFKNEDAWREFKIGAWLHDCGKITTPEYVVDKATKLETIYNRIHEIRTRFEVIWRDIEIEGYERRLQGDSKEDVEAWKENEHSVLLDEFNFIAECNIGGEFMSEEKQERVKDIAKRRWQAHFDKRAGLSDLELMRYVDQDDTQEYLLHDSSEHVIKREHFDQEGYEKDGFKLEVPQKLYDYGEVYNLCIQKGTLSHEERFKIQEHVIMTIKMLEKLPYPEGMENIPEYAGTHHETMIGTGYPKGLSRDDLSIPARIMALADIFEALTASDRPYKKGKTLSEALKIMSFMKKDEDIDADVFELFLRSGVYLEYAKMYLKPEQIDEVDIETYL